MYKEKDQLFPLLKKQLEQIYEDILRLKESSKPVEPENSLGRISRMDAIQSMNMNKALLQRKYEEKINLEETIRQIDKPDFGICVKCNKSIPYQRLVRVPESKLCMDCIRSLKK